MDATDRIFRFSALLVVAVLCGAHTAAAQSGATPAVAVRVYDYANVPSAVVRAAERFVDAAYREIGVRVTWNHARLDPSPDPTVSADRDVIIVILDAAMARQHAFAPEVVGAAAITMGDGGRVAYVLAEQVRALAQYAEPDADRLMGLVFAHELGHLLLPAGSHSLTGIMRPSWRMDEVRDDRDSRRFSFTPLQADQIRHRLERALQQAAAPSEPAFR